MMKSRSHERRHDEDEEEEEDEDEYDTLLQQVIALENEVKTLHLEEQELRSTLQSLEPIPQERNSYSEREEVEELAIRNKLAFHGLAGMVMVEREGKEMAMEFNTSVDGVYVDPGYIRFKKNPDDSWTVVRHSLPDALNVREMVVVNPLKHEKDVMEFIRKLQVCFESYYDRKKQILEAKEIVKSKKLPFFHSCDYRFVAITFKITDTESCEEISPNITLSYKADKVRPSSLKALCKGLDANSLAQLEKEFNPLKIHRLAESVKMMLVKDEPESGSSLGEESSLSDEDQVNVTAQEKGVGQRNEETSARSKNKGISDQSGVRKGRDKSRDSSSSDEDLSESVEGAFRNPVKKGNVDVSGVRKIGESSATRRNKSSNEEEKDVGRTLVKKAIAAKSATRRNRTRNEEESSDSEKDVGRSRGSVDTRRDKSRSVAHSEEDESSESDKNEEMSAVQNKNRKVEDSSATRRNRTEESETPVKKAIIVAKRLDARARTGNEEEEPSGPEKDVVKGRGSDKKVRDSSGDTRRDKSRSVAHSEEDESSESDKNEEMSAVNKNRKVEDSGATRRNRTEESETPMKKAIIVAKRLDARARTGNEEEELSGPEKDVVKGRGSDKKVRDSSGETRRDKSRTVAHTEEDESSESDKSEEMSAVKNKNKDGGSRKVGDSSSQRIVTRSKAKSVAAVKFKSNEDLSSESDTTVDRSPVKKKRKELDGRSGSNPSKQRAEILQRLRKRVRP